METDAPKKEMDPAAETGFDKTESGAAAPAGNETEASVPGTTAEASPDQEPVVEYGGKGIDPYLEAGRMMNEIQKQILMITETQDRNHQDMIQLHRDFYQSMQVQNSMQEELEKHRAGIFRQLLDPVLTAIARIYNDNMVNLEKIEDPKLRQNFKYLFDDLEQVLTENGIEVYVSGPEASFSPKYCKIRNKIPTSDKALHGKVIKSYNKGFYTGPRVLAPEFVDVYVFDANTGKEE
jgi:molecular chaperone GrpE (heat shock protein)